MMRYFIGVKDGLVDGVRRSEDRAYTHVVHRKGPIGWFTTFHPNEAQARHSAEHLFASMATVEIDRAFEVTRDYEYGEPFDPLTLVRALTADGQYQQRSE